MQPTLVLDTNVVLDWLVFREPACASLADAIILGRARWLATHAMRDELDHVLARGSLDAWLPDTSRIEQAWASFATLVPAPDMSLAASLRCTDPDDQKFIDLALSLPGSALISHDRAVLRLAGRARPRGVDIMTTATWIERHRPA